MFSVLTTRSLNRHQLKIAASKISFYNNCCIFRCADCDSHTVQLFVFILCFHQGDYFTNVANLMSRFLIFSDNWIGQKQRISGDIWLKAMLQRMQCLTVKASVVSKYLLCCVEPLCSTNQSASIWNFSWRLSHTIRTPQRHLSYGTVGGLLSLQFVSSSLTLV